jgi:hypothetical protein
MKIPILDKISDFDIIDSFEVALRDKNSELVLSVGYFTAEVDRDEKGVKLTLRVSAMVGDSGEDEFKTNPELANVIVEFPEGSVLYQVEETVSVSGMEIEVTYRPTGFKPAKN